MDKKEVIKQRFYIFYNYIVNKQGVNVFFDMIKNIVDKAYNDEDLKTLLEINKEMNVWLREMFLPTEKEELLLILKSELNEDSESDFINKVNKIISKGKISSKKEYEIVHQRVESIYSDEGKEMEVKKINELLAGFNG